MCLQQVLLARPDLAGQFQNLPALPPAADGLATVLANMAALAQNLNTQGVDVDSLFQNSGSDPALGAVNDLAQTLSGRRLLQVWVHCTCSCSFACIMVAAQCAYPGALPPASTSPMQSWLSSICRLQQLAVRSLVH